MKREREEMEGEREREARVRGRCLISRGCQLLRLYLVVSGRLYYEYRAVMV
jgi:hypothetical protein